MSIGREIGRKVVLDVPSTETQGPQPVVTVAGWHGRRISQKKVGPNPGEATECHFQAASPVYANGIRILGMPVLPLVKYFVRELFIPRKPVCLRQRDKVLMPIQLPNNFAVAHLFEAEVMNLEPKLSRCSLTVDPIEMPVNLLAVIEVLIAKQIETMAADLLCAADNFVCLSGKPLFEL